MVREASQKASAEAVKRETTTSAAALHQSIPLLTPFD